MFLGHGFLPEVCVAGLFHLGGLSLAIRGRLEGALFILGDYIAVHELHQKLYFQVLPGGKLLLGRAVGELRYIFHNLGKRGAGNHDIPAGFQFFLQLDGHLVVHDHGHAVHGVGTAFHLVHLEGIHPGADIRGHLVVHLVAGVGNAVVEPEGGSGRIVQAVSVPLPEALGHLGNAGSAPYP